MAVLPEPAFGSTGCKKVVFKLVAALRITWGISERTTGCITDFKSESQKLARSAEIGSGQLGPSLQASVKVAQLCLTLCDPMDYGRPGSSVHGILQARILEWVAIPFSRASSPPRDQTRVSCSSCITQGFFTAELLVSTHACKLVVEPKALIRHAFNLFRKTMERFCVLAPPPP